MKDQIIGYFILFSFNDNNSSLKLSKEGNSISLKYSEKMKFVSPGIFAESKISLYLFSS